MELNLKKTTKADLVELLNKSENDLAEMTHEKVKLEVKYKEKISEITSLTDRVNKLNTVMKMKNEQYEELSQELALANGSVAALQEAIDDLTTKHQILEFSYKNINRKWGAVCGSLLIAFITYICIVILG